MALIFAGVPLSDGTTPPHPDVQSAMEWVRANLRAQNIFPLDIETWNGISAFGGYGPDKPVRPHVLYWPVGATRWANLSIIATQEQITAIRNAAPSGRAILEISWYDHAGVMRGQITPTMTLLPAKPLSEASGNGLFLLTFVDDRYFWWRRQTPAIGESTDSFTWQAVFTGLASNLGITVTQDSVASVYANPTVNINDIVEFAPPVLDMACFYFGHRLTRSTTGAIKTRTPTHAKTDATTNAGLGTCMAGGAFLLKDLHNTIPTYIKLILPRNDNDKFAEDVTTAGPYPSVNAPVPATAGPTAVSLSVAPLKGITGNGKTKDLLTTYEADYTTGSPANQATMDSLTAQMASDYYLWSMLLYDKKFVGIVPLVPDGFHDIEWTYHGQEVSTRMIPYLYEGLFASAGSKNPSYTNLTVTGTATIQTLVVQQLKQTRAAVTISANTNNLAIGTTSTWLEFTLSGGNYDLTGMANGSDGRQMELYNSDATDSLTIKHDATSTAANRFYCPGGTDVVLKIGESVFVKYSSTVSRWIVLLKCCSPLTTKGDIYTYSTVDTRLPVGTNGYRLKADSGAATGVSWSATTGGLFSQYNESGTTTNSMGQTGVEISSYTAAGWWYLSIRNTHATNTMSYQLDASDISGGGVVTIASGTIAPLTNKLFTAWEIYGTYAPVYTSVDMNFQSTVAGNHATYTFNLAYAGNTTL